MKLPEIKLSRDVAEYEWQCCPSREEYEWQYDFAVQITHSLQVGIQLWSFSLFIQQSIMNVVIAPHTLLALVVQ